MPRVIAAQRVASPSAPSGRGRVLYGGVPTVGLIRKNKGWQVQSRPSEGSTAWVDVEGGWFPTRDEAEEQAPYLCGF